MSQNFIVYVHITPNNKKYFGITKQLATNRWHNGDGYNTQTLFYRAIKKYGWNNIQHIILLENLSKEMACECEKYLIAKFNTTNSKFGYNVSIGGDGPFGVIRSDKTKEKLRLANLGHHHSDETKKKISKNNARCNKGMKLSQERIQKMIDGRKGKPNWNEGKKMSPEFCKKLSDAHKGQVPWNKGIPCSDYVKKCVSEANKGRRSCWKDKNLPDEMKHKISESLKNRVWVNDGTHRTLIHQSEVRTYIDMGYKLGKKF